MVEVLRDIESGANSYLKRVQDFKTLNRLNPNDVLWNGTNDATLNDINEFARRVSERCAALLVEVEPIFDKLSTATDESIDKAVRLMASRYNQSAERIDELVSLFLKLTGMKSKRLDYDYERAVLLNDRGPKFEKNTKKLYFDVMSEVDRTMVRSVDLVDLLDVRELLSRNDAELAMLAEYFRRSTDSGHVTLFDLLFRPKVTIAYVPRIVGLLTLRQIGLDKLSELFDWIRARSLELRANAHEESEMMNKEMKRLNFARSEIESDLILTKVREKPYYERYLSLVRYKHEATERINELNRNQLRVQNAVRFLGNTARVVDYYIELERNYLSNLTDDFRYLNAEVEAEESIDLVESLSKTDADNLRSVTNAYRDYRDILLNYMKILYAQSTK